MHGPLLCYRWSKDHGLLISSEKGVKKKRIPTSWVMHAQDQHGSGLESVMFWLQRINFYTLKKQREKGIALVLKAKISGWQEAATCIYGMDRMIGSLAFWGCYFSFPSALRSVALFGWQDSFFAIWWCCCLLNWSIKWSMLITRISFHLWNRVGLRSTNTELLFFPSNTEVKKWFGTQGDYFLKNSHCWETPAVFYTVSHVGLEDSPN